MDAWLRQEFGEPTTSAGDNNVGGLAGGGRRRRWSRVAYADAMTRGWHVPRDGGETFSAPFVNFEAAFLADGSESDGDLLVYRGVGLPGVDHALHAHDDSTEAFFVQSGEAAIYVDGKWFNARAGDFVGVPRGAAHGWRVVGSEPVRIVIIHAPASGYAAAWREFDRLAREGLAAPDRIAATAEQHVRVRFLGRLPGDATDPIGSRRDG